MLLEDLLTGESRMVPLRPQGVVYVPGHTAHRTVNVGKAPLTYLAFIRKSRTTITDANRKKEFPCLILERNAGHNDRKKLIYELRHQTIHGKAGRGLGSNGRGVRSNNLPTTGLHRQSHDRASPGNG